MKRATKTSSKIMLILLTFVMMLGMVSVKPVRAAEEKMKVFSLDAGRKYFSEVQIKELIDTISSRGFSHLHLLIGNDGFRLHLDNLNLEVNGKQYSHEEVKNALHSGNVQYYREKAVNEENKELTQAEMDRIFDYAKSKNIEIIPGFNTPGHMNAILTAMETLGLQNVRFTGANDVQSKTTINLLNQDARTFTQELFKKYVQYFASKGAKIVNFGADEYANDLGSYGGFKGLNDIGLYGSRNGYVGYVNELAKIIKDASMRPMAFNDGIYYKPTGYYKFNVEVPFDTDIIISYWIAGYWGYDVASAEFLKSKGFDLLNTNDGWYYVIGLEDEVFNGNPYFRTKALANMAKENFKFDRHSAKSGQPQVETIGSMMAVWADFPGKTYEADKVKELINTFADQNATYFKKASGTVVTPTPGEPSETQKPMSVLSLDAGRKYFSLDQLKEIITSLSDLGYTHLHLLFANDGMRFLLNDLQLDVNNEVYSSEQVKEALIAGNDDYAKAITKHKSMRIPANEDKYLTEAEMDELLVFAKSKNVKIIPGLNSPGHMDAIVFAMEKLGINDAFFTYNGRKSRTTLNFNNDKTTEFTKALVKKYVDYFETKKDLGVEIFNFGADEYGQDITYHVNNGPSGFTTMQNLGLYDKFTQYVNELSQIIKVSGLKPMAFNDGFYYNNVEPNQKFDTDIIISYWNAGFDRYTLASARKLRDKGHKILNTNDAWYYVLGLEYGGWYGLPYATGNMSKAQHKFDKVTGDNTNVDTIGSMVAIWADNPAKAYRFSNLERLIKTFKAQNPGFIVKEEVKLGKAVILKFETKEGQKLAEPIIVVDEGQPLGTKYDANRLLKLSLTDSNGIYYANPTLKQNSAQLTGDVKEQEQVITLVYSTVPGGKVKVRLETVAGELLEETELVQDGQPVGTKYDAKALEKPFLNDQNGILYNNPVLKENSAQIMGAIKQTEQVVTFVYSTVAGEKVILRYETTEGKELKVRDILQAGQPVGTKYNLSGQIEPEIADKDGLLYGNPVHKEGSAREQGAVTSSEQVVIYVYELQLGSEVIVKFVDEKGNSIIKDEELIPSSTAKGTKYDYTPKIKKEITNNDGLVFELVVNDNQEPILQEGSALIKGEVTEQVQRIVFVYKAKPGKAVVVKYEDAQGNVLKEVDAVKENTQVGIKYDVTTLLEKEITVNNVKYVLPKLKENSALEKGTISADTQVITYVFEKLNDKKPLTTEVKKENEVLKDVKYTEATPEKQEAYTQALAKAKEILDQFNPSQEKLEEALNNLAKAKSELDGVAYEIKTLTDNKHAVENVKVKPTTSLSVKEMDKNKVATLKDKDVILYDITFNDLIKGKGINIGEGDYTVHLSLNDRRQVSNVYYVSETGELQSLAFTQKENEVIFKTTHFSLYAVEFKKVKSNQNSTVKPQENEKPNINTKKDTDTSDSTNLGFVVVMGLISILGLAFLSRKRIK